MIIKKAKDYLTDDGTRTLDEARDVKTFTIDANTYAIVAAFMENGVQIIDISDPDNPDPIDAAVSCFYDSCHRSC